MTSEAQVKYRKTPASYAGLGVTRRLSWTISRWLRRHGGKRQDIAAKMSTRLPSASGSGQTFARIDISRRSRISAIAVG